MPDPIDVGYRLASLLDTMFGRRDQDAGAIPVDPPVLLTGEFLRALNHPTEAPYPPVPVEGTSSFLPTATCYRLFQVLAGDDAASIPAYTVGGPCFRREDTHDEAHRFAFTMRETILFGTTEHVAEHRSRHITEETDLAASLGLDVEVRQANDAFFSTEGGRGRRLLQRLLQLKFEMVTPIKGADVPLTSFNLHRDHFTSKLNIGPADHRLSSGCTARGIERWAAALRHRWGDNLAEWPSHVTDTLQGRPG